MSSPAWQRWRTCDRKKSFETESKANRFGVSRNLYSYQCPYCFCWHVTKKKPHTTNPTPATPAP